MRLRRNPRPDIHAPDPASRRAAIDAAVVGHNALRRVVTHDPDRGVRCAAIRRLQDLIILRQVCESESDEVVREAARVRYRQLLSGGDTLDIGYRHAALKACSDAQIIAHVARSAREPSLRRAALGLIDEWGLLEEIRCHDPDPTVRSAAADRLINLRS
ncbi:hypothetical protein [Spiribacter roseus]|uniref:HEAT repeat domain-containing protein n=1 Tax=Spiribacter roseus TaxID=1855875 RepID=A0ABV3RXE4_9GAMM